MLPFLINILVHGVCNELLSILHSVIWHYLLSGSIIVSDFQITTPKALCLSLLFVNTLTILLPFNLVSLPALGWVDIQMQRKMGHPML